MLRKIAKIGWCAAHMLIAFARHGDFSTQPLAWDRALSALCKRRPRSMCVAMFLLMKARAWKDPYRFTAADDYIFRAYGWLIDDRNLAVEANLAYAWVRGESRRFALTDRSPILDAVEKTYVEWQRVKRVSDIWPSPVQRLELGLHYDWMALLMDAMKSELEGDLPIAFEQYRKAYNAMPKWIPEATFSRDRLDQLLIHSEPRI